MTFYMRVLNHAVQPHLNLKPDPIDLFLPNKKMRFLTLSDGNLD